MGANEDVLTNLASSVDNFGRKVLSLVSYCLAECVFDRGVVAVNKVPIDELNRKRRFACTLVVSDLSDQTEQTGTYQLSGCRQWPLFVV